MRVVLLVPLVGPEQHLAVWRAVYPILRPVLNENVRSPCRDAVILEPRGRVLPH